MQSSSKHALVTFLSARTFATVLDAPSGDGWLANALRDRATVDGVDLYANPQGNYRRFWQTDLDKPLPGDCNGYDIVCCCEGLEHVGSPLQLLREFHRALNPGGLLIVTTPNTWYPQARLQYLFRGFFPSFPSLAGKVMPGTHMHITPWSYPQLYVHLRLAGFSIPQIISESLSAPKHLHERLLGIPAQTYCRRREKRARLPEERTYWHWAGSPESIFGRHLIVVAEKNAS